jgi:hypothetical protein
MTIMFAFEYKRCVLFNYGMFDVVIDLGVQVMGEKKFMQVLLYRKQTQLILFWKI